MKSIILTRLIHWKKQWFHLLFWLLFPIVATTAIMLITNAIQDETKVPVGIVLEEDTPLAEELYESIQSNPLVRVYNVDERDGIDQLNKRELDSVFIIKKGYEDKINRGSRNRLITGYQSDFSFAYMPVKEVVLSYVQQDAARTKAIFVINQLSEQFAKQKQWTQDEILETSKQIQVDQQLLQTSFSFFNKSAEDKGNDFTLLHTWNIWALFALLATLLLFDWSIKERKPSIKPRFVFMRVSLKNYLLKNLFIYIGLLFLFDIIAIFSFSYFLDEEITLSMIGVIFSYRILISFGAFLLSLTTNNQFLFYSVSFLMTLIIAVGSGALIPIDGLLKRFPWIKWLNPLDAFLSMEYVNIWLLGCIILIMIWYMRKEKHHA
ncbi:MAG TPA: ABC transporter permease [Candidatus Dormibacteraeota bacterium]|nr:ABC transporter permease [Candidatus Dormibacteraeota bacterium]